METAELGGRRRFRASRLHGDPQAPRPRLHDRAGPDRRGETDAEHGDRGEPPPRMARGVRQHEPQSARGRAGHRAEHVVARKDGPDHVAGGGRIEHAKHGGRDQEGERRDLADPQPDGEQIQEADEADHWRVRARGDPGRG